MFETLPASASTVTKSGKYGPFNQVKREVTTRWVLGEAGGKQVVVDLVTYHHGDTKSFSTSLTWGTVETQERHPNDGPGTFSVYSWASDHAMVRLPSVPVARYSVKALDAHHAYDLAKVKANFEHTFRRVFVEAAERSGLEVSA